MSSLDDAIRAGLAPHRGLGLDDARLRAARAQAAAGGPTRARWVRVAGAVVALAGLGGLVAVLAVLALRTPHTETTPPAEAPSTRPVTTYPDTAAGRRGVTRLFRQMSRPGEGRQVRVATIDAGLNVETPRGTFTVWSARTDRPGFVATVVSSPRFGPFAAWVKQRGAKTPALTLVGLQWSPAQGAREAYGTTAPSVARVVANLRNGTRAEAMTGNGWFVFTQDFGHSAPARFMALDSKGRRLGEDLVVR